MALLHTLRARARQSKRWIHAVGRKLDIRRMTEAEFADLLAGLGFREGGVVMVHSSMDSISRRVPSITPIRLIELMQTLLGSSGTLLMPTFPFTGLQSDYADKNKVFDVKKTPSRMGLLTEIFRRSPGVHRSLHPTHPVAGWGKAADILLDTHHLGTTFGTDSPFCKMKTLNGVVVGLGVSPHSFTLFHAVEEMHPKTFQYQYEQEPREMTIVVGHTNLPYEFLALRADRVRDYSNAIRILESEGVLKHKIHLGLEVCTSEARPFFDRALQLISQGAFDV